MHIETGATLPLRHINYVSPDTMRVWATILHDPNPIHLDRTVVNAKGLGDRLINQGPINVGYLIDMLQAAFPGAGIGELTNRFIDNVYEGDVLEAGGTITAVEQTAGKTQVHCDVYLKALERDLVITGKAVVSLTAIGT